MEPEYYVREAKADIARLGAKVEALEAKAKVHEDLLDYLQEHLWNELNQDLGRTLNGRWSIAAEGTVTRIIWLARTRGVTGGDKIQLNLIASGVYAAVCEKLGVKCVIDYDIERYRQYWERNVERYTLAVPFIKELEVEEFTHGEE